MNGIQKLPNGDMTILVVEDDSGLNQLIQKTLQQAGFSTKGVSNGREAIEVALRNREIIMLLDYELPDTTGKEVIEHLRKHNRVVPFIIVTGHGDEKIAVEMMKMGARDYIVKSTGLREILPHILSRVRCDLEREKKLNLTESSLQLERHRMINILDTMADGVYIENERHEIEYANPSLQLTFGNFSRKKCSDYFLEDNESLCSWCEKNDHGEYETSRLEWHSARNEKTYDLLTTPLINPDGSFSVMGIFRDITDFKTARAEIESRVKELEEFYEMAVGRELKMKELKEEVDRLREEINNLKNKAQI